MKNAIALLLFAIAAQAHAATAWMNAATHDVWWYMPPTVSVGGVAYVPPNPDIMGLAGFVPVEYDDSVPMHQRVVAWSPASIRAKTAQELSTEAQAAQAEAEAQAAHATLPQTFENGVAVMDEDGHWLELVPVGDDVVPIQISNSPLDPATRAAMKSNALALANSGKSAFRAANAELKAALTNDIAQAQAISVNATSSTAQVRSAVIDLRRELIDAQRNIQEMRRLLLKYAKEDDQ